MKLIKERGDSYTQASADLGFAHSVPRNWMLFLLLRPGMRVLAKLPLSKALAAPVIISLIFGFVGGFGSPRPAPGTEWVAKAPQA